MRAPLTPEEQFFGRLIWQLMKEAPGDKITISMERPDNFKINLHSPSNQKALYNVERDSIIFRDEPDTYGEQVAEDMIYFKRRGYK